MRTVKLFDGHEIEQSDRFFKLTQDSVLLADFARVATGERALDLGAGIGCLGVLVMLRGGGDVDGIEIEPDAAALASSNYARCGLAARGSVRAGDIRDLPRELAQKYDVCVSNPPYFSQGHGAVSEKSSIARARTDITTGTEDIFLAARFALKTGGRFYICHKPGGLPALLAACAAHGFAAGTLRLVHQSAEKPANLAMLEARLGRACKLEIMPPLFITSGGEPTEEYRRIYSDTEGTVT